MVDDRRGLEWSGSDPGAMRLFDDAVMATACFHGDPLGLCKAALELDPGLHAARLLQGHVLALSLNSPFRTAAFRSFAPLLAEGVSLNRREAMHLAAIQAWLEGEPENACNLLGSILDNWPTDLMALFFSHQADFFAARNAAMAPRLAQVLQGWSPELEGHSLVLGMQAFALEEAGQYGEAEALALEAVERQPLDAWAIHARGHVLEMQGRVDEGIDWYRQTGEQWSKDCFFSVHNWWHWALYHLDREEHGEVLALYDRGIAPHDRSISLNLCDAAGMLWRLWLHGVDTGGRFGELAERFAAHGEAPCHVFNDVHAGMTFAACGQWERLEHLRARLGEIAAGSSGYGRMLRLLGLPVIAGVETLARGDATAALNHFDVAMKHADLMTGSHAQRDILALTLIEAEIRGGRKVEARSRLEGRARQRRASEWIAHDLARC